ncbi:PEP-CTERM sorting domain-containing protein [Geitlerinema sp. PCC 7407]|uniref:PEP-CTERM sorting domain-containing protein n=1 Tax=Geitlerinema sp. PCC 7407 TaxID=1173025 RepID=UPI00029FC79F|nr:PEP-CTERM sorting domain-containing protein [Geitlerinema sp. PCC 7407]AFY67511.1 hypothetical protein GEI7407_3041 [Geitlerinema sp. PCC 7407]
MTFKRNLASLGLVAGSLLAIASPGQAASLTSDVFGSGGISFDQDTTLAFDFLESRGKYRSNFGVYVEEGGDRSLVETLFSEVGAGYDPGSTDASNDWLGTCGVTVLDCAANFTFRAGQTYFFGLTGANGTVFSDGLSTVFRYASDGSYTYNTQGPNWIQNNPGVTPDRKTVAVGSQEVLVAINDSYEADVDVNDFIVKASPVERVPEPSALAGLAIAASAWAFSRRRAFS